MTFESSPSAEALDRWIRRVSPRTGLAQPGAAEVEASSMLAPGDRVGEFRLIGLLGEGGMGQVWEAEQESLERRVALKLIRPGRLDRKSQALFAREARAGGKLNHPGIVTVFDHGQEGARPWISQELVNGSRSLRELILEWRDATDLPPEHYRAVAELIVNLADALQAAHAAGVVHRDLKPGNVLLTPEGTSKVTDFGLARIENEPSLSTTGEIAGTWLYMSPEQVMGNKAGVDHRTDIFSLGVVMYELLALQRPFEGDTSHQIAHKILSVEPVDLRRIRSRVPRDLAVICGKALEKSRERRYAAMSEMGEDLRRFLNSEPILAKPPSSWERGCKWVRRNPTRSVAGVIVTVALVVVATLLIQLQSRNEILVETQADLEVAYSDLEGESEKAMPARIVGDLEVLKRQAELLWPPKPSLIEEMERWISRARVASTTQPELNRARDEIRGNALPQSQEERQSDLDKHPLQAIRSGLQAELDWRQVRLEFVRGGQDFVFPPIRWSDYPTDTRGLINWAYSMINPRRENFGDELIGVQLAERAVEVAPEEERSNTLFELARANLTIGDYERCREALYLCIENGTPEQIAKIEWAIEELEQDLDVDLEQGVKSEQQRIRELERELAEIDQQLAVRLSWAFPDGAEEDARQHRMLTTALQDIELFTDGLTGYLSPVGLSPGIGWSLPRRLRVAQDLRDGFAADGRYARRWASHLEQIRAAYPGTPIEPVLGLVPLGQHPESGLWEFWDVRTGLEPVQDLDGQWRIEDDTGIVFVLLRGGEFWMGAQGTGPNSRNYDSQARGDEDPAHRVILSPFFISKYELTQGQWKYFMGEEPSFYGENGYWRPRLSESRADVNLTHPVEQVNWTESALVLSRLGFSLPSEAQWEYAARAGASTPWWDGRDYQGLSGAANIADDYQVMNGGSGNPDKLTGFHDGFTTHSPVGTFRANALGLHDMLGNVFEWCRDSYDAGFYGRCPLEDPLSEGKSDAARVLRGGGFNTTPQSCRLAVRAFNAPTLKRQDLGLRPVLPLGSGFE